MRRSGGPDNRRRHSDCCLLQYRRVCPGAGRRGREPGQVLWRGCGRGGLYPGRPDGEGQELYTGCTSIKTLLSFFCVSCVCLSSGFVFIVLWLLILSDTGRFFLRFQISAKTGLYIYMPILSNTHKSQRALRNRNLRFLLILILMSQQVFNPDGSLYSIIDSHGSKLKRPTGVAVTRDHHAYVVDIGLDCIRKYRYK